MNNGKDVSILRELARTVAEISARPVQEERRELWRRHNSLIRTRPLIYVRWFAAWEDVFPDSDLQCQAPFFRRHERFLRQMIYQDRTGDDFIVEPWISVGAVHKTASPDGPWGLATPRRHSGVKGGAWKADFPLKDEADLDKLVPPHHAIDEQATARNVELVREAIGDILEVNAARGCLYTVWHADIATDLGYLRGIEPMMWDMSDRPQWLHRLCGFLRDGVLTAQQEAEDAGDWRLSDHHNQAAVYSEELSDPRANSAPVKRKQLWAFAAAQEFAQVGPAMHEEFLLRYQIPILSQFGLSAYGCCEDLTHKIGILRKIPNLRRIAVTPWANVARCAEQIGQDYVLSWRPSPAEMVCNGFVPDRVRKVIREGLGASRGCHVDITLKDVERLPAGFQSLVEWTRIVREIVEDYA